jgi:hypothetical protein
MKEQIQLVDINPAPSANVAGTTVLTLPVGRIHGVEIIGTVAGAKAAAGFKDIRFMLGGNQQRLSTIAQLSDALSVYGAEYDIENDKNGGPFALLYPFSENWRKQYRAAERFAFDNLADQNGNPIKDAQIEIDFLETAAAKTLKFRAIVEPFAEVTDPQTHNAFVKHFRKSYPIAGDVLYINDMPRKDAYQLIEFYDPTGGEGIVNEVRIKINGKQRFHRTKDEQDRDLRRWGMFPRDGVFTVVPDLLDNTEDAWDMSKGQVKTFEIQINTDVASTGNVSVITHRYGLPE